MIRWRVVFISSFYPYRLLGVIIPVGQYNVKSVSKRGIGGDCMASRNREPSTVGVLFGQSARIVR